jgi:DNA-binding MarR family transcriptional regulator
MLFRAVNGISAPHWIDLDLTMAQLKGLLALSAKGELSIGGLAGELRVPLPTASIIVDQLVERGLASRREDPRDRRRTLTALTPKAEQLAARLQGGRELVREWLLRLDDAELAMLVQGLEAVERAVEASPGAGSRPVAAGRRVR